jgi:hypothetical protein
VLVGATALATGAIRFRAPLDALASLSRAEGIKVEARAVERGLFQDTLRDVRASLPGGAVVRAREATLSRSPLGAPSLSTPAVEMTLAGEPMQAFSLAGRVSVPEGIELRASRTSVRYRDRAIGGLVLEGVSRRPGPGLVLHAEALALGSARFSDVAFSVAQKRQTLEILLGTGREASARATATYVPSDGRSAEWRIVLPHQPFGDLRRALGLGEPAAESTARVGGTVSWIVPDDVSLAPRGSFRFVLDGWPRPHWPDASALTGSSGAIAAVITPSVAGSELRLERVEVAAALFELRGSGTITLDGAPKVAVAASGRRTCAELAQGLPGSRHREAVRAFLGLGSGASPPALRDGAADARRAEEWVELGLRVELVLGPAGTVRFRWHLSAGCGLPELTAAAGE